VGARLRRGALAEQAEVAVAPPQQRQVRADRQAPTQSRGRCAHARTVSAAPGSAGRRSRAAQA